MKKDYFSELIPELAVRAARATISRLGFSSTPLRKHLVELFSADYGQHGCFLGDPVFEATFGWKEAPQTLRELAQEGLLSHDLVDALDRPDHGRSDDYRFPEDVHPYTHQLQAWQLLMQDEPASVVVTSGTGSGKTECFMVPILDQLIRNRTARGARLVGVEALFLYPLNALIQSQRERLNAWTATFDDQIRYCLYNGLTPERVRGQEQADAPNEVLDRRELRASPPPILVTNSTMLEYMLVRAQDAPILQESKGKLRWIVLDEAHTYIGSQAAELALLLRRVLHAFRVRPEQVRFVATSATIGGDDTVAQLQEFLATVAGQPLEQVHVVSGERHIPELIQGNSDYAKTPLSTLRSLQPGSAEQFEALCGNSTARKIRQLFTRPNHRAVKLSELGSTVQFSDASTDANSSALRWLDLLTSATLIDKHKGLQPFLPLRLHLFHDVLQGLWACADPSCQAKQSSTLDTPDWPFGMVFVEPKKQCNCGAPIYELRSCNECNTTFLWAKLAFGADNYYRLVQSTDPGADEFALDIEPEADADGPDDVEDTVEIYDSTPVLIANGHLVKTDQIHVDRETLITNPSDLNNSIRLRVREETEDRHGKTGMACPQCEVTHSASHRSFRPARLGAPFLLGEIIPTLFEFSPDIATKIDKPLERPMRGRRMLSFTDSRQGSARIAARLQQDSERNRIRGLIYQRVTIEGARTTSVDMLALQTKIAEQREALSLIPENNRAEVAALFGLDKSVQNLANLSEPKPQSFNDMIGWLSTSALDVKTWIFDHYRALDPTEFGSSSGLERLCKILLAREFARRPKRMNSLETMGLVRTAYPRLDIIQTLPTFQPGTPAIALDEWKAFLKICLDFYVRENSFIDLPDAWRKWGGQRISAKQLLSPDSQEIPTRQLRKWPQCNKGIRQNRLVRLLAHAYDLDPSSDTDFDVLNGVLRAAWQQLCTNGLLQQGSSGRYLSLDDIAFAPISKAWICPVTRRILDVTLRGITPYLPPNATAEAVIQCEPVDIPRCEPLLQDYPNNDGHVAAVRTWANEHPLIQDLRLKGLWSDLNDRTLEGAAFFRAAEHSAQQPSARLSEYESLFKTGNINLLSCSTTMEMGVDIGGISIVAMTNVPPHPANYLQRAGRAGRRSETRSVALALCKNNPHDQSVLRDTLWAFNTQLPPPVVLLSSPIIVQRHMNSMLLAEFMLREISGSSSAEKLNLEWWLLPRGEARYQRFCAWAECFDQHNESQLASGLRSLLRHTPFDGIASLDQLCGKAATMAREHADSWYREYDAVQVELDRFPSPKSQNEPAFKALSIQRRRLTEEYLLRELASEGFLPGYGFPTNISSFETLTCDELERQRTRARQDRDMGRVDNRMRSRDLPSRDAVTALREYAPGSEVVIDGLVYRSAGITLNWHTPTSNTDAAEIQNIRQAWRCVDCGSSGTWPRTERLTECLDCSASLTQGADRGFDYLAPAGFAVDLYTSPHNDVSTQTFTPVATPWINAQGEWMPLSNPALGLHRSSPTGQIFNYTAGSNNSGFGICLSCGRAEHMKDDGSLSDIFYDHQAGRQREHKRLRGRQGGDAAVCEGSWNSFAILRNVRLGHETRTDVLELLLKGMDNELITDRVTAMTLSVAIRNAIARLLGIEAAELGSDIKPVRIIKGKVGLAIVVFDRSASGYSSSVSGQLHEVFMLAQQELDCKDGCDAACQTCLLDFETRFRMDELDRNKALQFLSGRWLDEFNLPPSKAYFGESRSSAEYQSLVEAITRELAVPSKGRVNLFLSGDPKEWDIVSSPLRKHVIRWSTCGNEIRIILAETAVAHLSEADTITLNALTTFDENISLWQGSPPPVQSEFERDTTVLASVEKNQTYTAWATDTQAVGIPSSHWGDSEGALIIRGTSENPGKFVQPLTLSLSLPPSEANTHRVELIKELDGPISNFGKRLLSHIENKLSEALIPTFSSVVGIEYSDRYLNAPLPVALFLDFISAVRTRYRDNWLNDSLRLRIASMGNRSPRPFPPHRIWHDWENDEDRNNAITAACKYSGWDIELETVDKRIAAHSRQFDIHLSDGSVIKVWFDQGFGYWHSVREGRIGHFDFNAVPTRQGESIACMAGRIQGQDYETFMFVSR